MKILFHMVALCFLWSCESENVIAASNSRLETNLAPPCENISATDRLIDEKEFVEIGGIEQWITIKGSDCSNPVVLFIHGGPGNPMSLYANGFYDEWEREFTIVQWDQRSAGRTYGKNQVVEELTIERFNSTELTVAMMVEDGIAVSEYLKKRLGKEKIILTGSSWGSVLGVHMAKRRPDLFYAYVGLSQVVNYQMNLASSYKAVLARAMGDPTSIATLESIGPPPWENPRNFGKLRRILRVYEEQSTDKGPVWEIAPDYATEEERAAYIAGEDFSFLKYVGLKGDGMGSGIKLDEDHIEFELPVFFIQGEEDLMTMPDITRAYFNKINYPHKELIAVSRAGHDLNTPMLKAQYDVLKNRVLPFTK